jgi:hypothetical protein
MSRKSLIMSLHSANPGHTLDDIEEVFDLGATSVEETEAAGEDPYAAWASMTLVAAEEALNAAADADDADYPDLPAVFLAGVNAALPKATIDYYVELLELDAPDLDDEQLAIGFGYNDSHIMDPTMDEGMQPVDPVGFYGKPLIDAWISRAIAYANQHGYQ